MSTRIAVCCMLLAAVPLMASCARRKAQESSGQASGEAVVATDLDSQVEEAVQKLKKRTRVRMNKETRQEIVHLIGDLSWRHASVETEGVDTSVDAAAARQLEAIGAPAIPYLIDVTGREQAPIARQYALAIMQRIAQKDDRLLEFLPVFVRSMSDPNSAVRSAAIAQIGISAEEFRRTAQPEKLDALIPYLAQGLRDEDEAVRLRAAACLIQIDRRDLVSQKWTEDVQMGGLQP